MLCLLKFILILSLLNQDQNATLAHQMLSRRGSRPFVRALSNTSTASPLIQAPSSASSCTIGDQYCSSPNESGTVETDLEDQCLLWDPSCSGNRTLAIDSFFNPGFQNNLLGNECFNQMISVPSSGTLDCDKHNPPSRMSEFQEMKSWMRSQQCVAAATNWAANTPSNSNFSNSNFTYASAEDVKKSSEDPDSQMAIAMDPHPVNYTSGSPPSCCGLCDISAANVDIYYWPEPDANTSCLSIIGESVRPVDYGATTTEVSIDSTETSTATYWGCNPKTFDYYNPMVGGNVTYTTATTTAQITAIGSLMVKVPLVNPWSSPPCLETGVPSQASQGSNRSLGVRDNHSPMQERNYTLSIPSSITRNVSSPVTTVSGNFTL